MNHGVLAFLNPGQVEVEIWRADELEVRRGLSSELDEMWSYVARKRILVGYGTPLITTRGRCWPMCLDGVRTTSS